LAKETRLTALDFALAKRCIVHSAAKGRERVGAGMMVRPSGGTQDAGDRDGRSPRPLHHDAHTQAKARSSQRFLFQEPDRRSYAQCLSVGTGFCPRPRGGRGGRRAVAAPAGSTAGIQAGPGSELARLSTPTARHRHSHNHAAGHVAAPGSACSWLDLDVDGRAGRRVVFFPFNRWHLRTSYYLARTIRRVIHYQVSSQSTP
jgi:hypothetical protein